MFLKARSVLTGYTSVDSRLKLYRHPSTPEPQFSIGPLTIIPRVRMASESIAHEAEGAIDSEAIRARGIIVLVEFNYSETSLKRTPSGPSQVSA